MRIIVLGLGRVGVVAAACLLHEGHTVIGFDIDPSVMGCIDRGVPSFRESDVAEYLAAGLAAGRLRVTADVSSEADADLAFVCVGTPGLPDGSLDLSAIERAARDLGAAVRLRSPELPPIIFVFRSTLLPGSMNAVVLPLLARAAGASPGPRYDLVYHPEFIREGSAVADYLAPARIVIGERKKGTAGKLVELYRGVNAPVFMTSLEIAELAKLADNSFHALKISFANEIGRFAVGMGISPTAVFDIFAADTKLNLSASYLRPGGAFGGPCLPKDLLALAGRMREAGISAPVIDGVVESNSLHIDFLVREIGRRAARDARILLVGLSFKSGTDDVRQSPLVRLAERLVNEGYDLAIYDSDLVDGASGGFAAQLFQQLPSRLASTLLPSFPPSQDWDLIILGKNTPDVDQLFGPAANLLDIYRLEFDARTNPGH
jgi:GDP-mannose 6-dehydrogenase